MMPSVSQAPKTRLFSFRTLTMPSPQYACTCLNNCLFLQNAVNPLDVCCLWYTLLRDQEISYLEVLHILCRGFIEDLRMNYHDQGHTYGNKML